MDASHFVRLIRTMVEVAMADSPSQFLKKYINKINLKTGKHKIVRSVRCIYVTF